MRHEARSGGKWLLDLLSPRRERLLGLIPLLQPADWDKIVHQASRHRVLPLMSWRVRRFAAEHPEVMHHVPCQQLRRASLASTQSVLRVFAACKQITDALARAGVPAVFLKGVHLAADIYPEPGLRPMRDIDLLVSPDRCREALAAIESLGAVRDPAVGGDFYAWARGMHRLPPMLLPWAQIRVEIHTRLTPRSATDGRGFGDTAGWCDVYGTSAPIALGDWCVRGLSGEHLLLHLVVHTVFGHRLSNGPLAIADLGFLLSRYRIDWPTLWRLAEAQGAVRGCVLLLKLVEREWGPQPVQWMGHDVPIDDDTLDAAAALLVQESGSPGHLAAARAAVGAEGAVDLALRRIFIPRKDLALIYPVKADSLAAFAWYPRHWWRLVTKRLPEYLRYRRQPGVDFDVKALDVVEAWLTGPTAPPGRATP